MDDPLRVYLIDSLADLFHDAGNFVLRHGFASPKLMIQLSTSGHFHNDVDIGLVVEETVHFDDVWVIEIKLNF
jgi:hypothetical protein